MAETNILLKDYKSAADHFTHSHQPKRTAIFLKECIKKGHVIEKDLFITRSVLHLLSEENLKDANLLFKEFEGSSPLFNFLDFLLKAVERDSNKLYEILISKYNICLKSDPIFKKYLDKIGNKFFDIEIQKNSMTSMMENMLKIFN